MADEERSFAPNTASSNRAQQQGLGLGQQEMDTQQAPNRDVGATDPARTEPFDQRLERTTDADRPSQADLIRGQAAEEGPREAAAATNPAATGDLGAGTPPSVDVHDLGQEDHPQQDWGDAAAEGAMFSSNNTRKGVRTEAERGQGRKTRRMTKDIISRRT